MNNGQSNPPHLLKGKAGEFFINFCVGPDMAIEACHVFDVYDKDNIPDFLPNTNCVLLLGEPARNHFLPEYKNYSVSTQRGSVLSGDLSRSGPIFISSFTPQDTFDTKPWEALKNPLLCGANQCGMAGEGQEVGNENSEDSDTTDKNLGKTSPANYAFWLQKDTKKAIKLTRFKEETLTKYGQVKYDIYHPMDEVIDFLHSLDGTTFGLDIETDSELNINTVGFGNVHRVCVVPLIDHEYRTCYSPLQIGRFFRELQRVFRNPKTKVVIHNSLFDLFVLAETLNIHPPLQVFDTMLAQHRISPETEKSLGHCSSLYTVLPYHKDEGVFQPSSRIQSESLWSYNGKDVYSMMIIFHEQMEIINLNPGLASSVALANDMIRPYLFNSLLGIRIDRQEIQKIINENERKIIQYQRIIDLITGPGFKLLPTSPKACVTYFHELLRYKVVSKNEDTGRPSLASENLYKLKLLYPKNILIDFCIAYRQLKKENGSLKFTLWTPKKLRHQIPQITCTKNINKSLSPIVHPQENSSTNSIATENENKISEEPILSKPSSNKNISTGLQVNLAGQKKLTLDLTQSISLENLSDIIQLSPDRATTGWKLAGTSTFRLSSAALLKKWGTNLQNPSKGTIQIYKADEGKEFVQVDQAGAEALIVAYLTIHKGFRDLFLEGIKSHNYVALHLFTDYWKQFFPEVDDWLGLPPKVLKQQPNWKAFLKKIKSEDLKYYMAKKTCHSSNYDIHPPAFALSILKDSGGKIALSSKESERMLETYHGLFPEIRRWHIVTQSNLYKSRTLYNLFGHPRYFNGNLNHDTWQEAYAFVPQSTVGTITNYAFVQTHNFIVEHNLPWDLLNNKHDSLLVQVPKGEGWNAAKVIRGFLEQKLVSPRGEVFYMKSEASVGTNWGKYDKILNPEGLQEEA